MICSVILDIKNNQLNREFDYKIPDVFTDSITPGVRVLVPFGARKLMGFVVDVKEDINDVSYKMKEVLEILDLEPVISEELLKLGRELSEYYFSFLIENYLMMIPSSLKASYNKLIDFTNYDNSIDSINLIKKDRNLVYINEFKDYIKEINILKKKKLIDIIIDIKDKGKAKYQNMIHLLDITKAKTLKQQEILNYLSEINEDVELKLLTSDMGYSKSIIDTLIKNGALSLIKKEVFREGLYTKVDDKKIILNEEQANAYNIIKSSKGFDEYLIKGVCGSGKTEIYLNLIENVINQGKTAIMLVPEISLTPQMASRFKARFNDLVSIMHSQLSEGERYDQWRLLKQKKTRIVVGPRSALFAPIDDIGIIIMDEEQSDSYIQDNNPRYDAHFIAKKRAIYHNCPLVYGSATPLVKTNYDAINGKINLLTLNKRANQKPMPLSFIVDMREELMSGNRSVLSRSLKDELIKTINKNEQAVLLINRRGYSTFVMCRSCGEVIKCPHCDISLTYHKTKERLKCHYCNYEEFVPNICPKCQSPYIKHVGDGTQKLEEELHNILPEARVIRMDSDSTSKKNSSDDIINKFSSHEADILLGTQVVAKGLDFPLVSLVGIVNADLGLKMPFYDSYEKTYNLIEQASGRAGRKDTDGKVIIQTYNPDNIAIRSAACHNYDMFYKEELKNRNIASTPPYSNLIHVLVSSQDQSKAYKEIYNVKKMIEVWTNAQVLGPVNYYIFKVKDRFQYELTIKLKDEDISILNVINQKFQSIKDCYISIKRM